MADEKELIEEIKGLGETTKEAVKKSEERLQKMLSDKADATEKAVTEKAVKAAQDIIDEVKKSVEATDEQIGKLQVDLKKSQDEFTKFKAEQGTQFGPNHGIAVDIADVIMKELKKPEAKEQLLRMKKNGSEKASFVIHLPDFTTKSVHTMTRTDVTGGTHMLTSTDPGTVGFARRQPFVRNVVNVSRTNKQYVRYTELYNPEGGAGMTAEGEKKTQASFQWVERTIEVKKVTSFIKVSKEALEDIEEAEGDIRAELIELIELKLDEQLLKGDGNTNNIKGIDAWATSFSAGSLAGSVTNANNADVVRIARAIMGTNHFVGSVIFMSPLDTASLDVEKAVDGHYILPPFRSSDGQYISGVRVIENPGVTQGTAYLMDPMKVRVKLRSDLELFVGYENDDFTKNLVTFLAEIRAAMYVASNNANALVKIDFATAKTTLESGSSS